MPERWSLRPWQDTSAQGSRAGSARHGARAGAAAAFTPDTALGQGSQLQPRGQAELMVRGPRY